MCDFMKKHLAKLLGVDEDNMNSNEIKYLTINKICANPYQPRKNFDIESLTELKKSILQYGVLQPILVRHISGGNYELIAGERRWRASQLAGLSVIPAVIKELDDQMMAEIALIENLQRENLSVVDEAQAYRQLIDQFQYTQEQLSQRIGKSQSAIANKLRLLKLPDFVLNELNLSHISERHARALLKTDDSQQLDKYLKEIMDNNLTVKQTEEMIKDCSLNENISREINKNLVPKKKRRKVIIKDFRLFKNTIDKSLETLKEGGFSVSIDEKISENEMELHIIIKK